jgi:hypothetical protein
MTEQNQPWRQAIHELSSTVSKTARVETPLNVNVVFHVPGHLLRPEFEGVRTSSFFRKDSLLIVQVALPEAPPPNPLEFLKSACASALDAAEAWAKRRKVSEDVERLRSSLGPP